MPAHLDVFENGLAEKLDFCYSGPQGVRISRLVKEGRVKVGAIHTYLELYSRYFCDLTPHVSFIAADAADRDGNLYTGVNTEDTPAIVEAIGLGAAIDYVNSIGKARIAAHEHDLLTYAQDRLREINSLRIIGTAKHKGPVISFELKGAHPHDVATVIDRAGVAVRAGTHCVMPLLERFNVTATCRASFGLYNTRAEVDHLAEALLKARDLFS